jgi:peptidoglycan/LPS O-acetylase OafA/YrhL
MRSGPPLSNAIQYRPDVDGLRAVAVLPVIAYHLGFRPIPGGFIGVDVFFVISGFLIGALVFKELEQGRFSFAGFYVRRIRRLFPALLAMMAATTIGAYFIIYPSRYEEFAQSLAAATFSVSNIYFFLTAGYFDGPAITKPLLHTWSLAVEEQFYLLFPPLALWLTTRMPNRTTLIIAIIGAVSFVWSAITAFTSPNESFYLLHTRAWELALGLLLARGFYPPMKSALVRTSVAGAGVLMIVASVFLITREMPFPGLMALPACLGTAMVIAAGSAGGNLVGRLLSWKPIVFVGLISYSLYLWHWPIIVLYYEYLGANFLALHQKFLLLPLIFAVSILSWRYIEQPFRRGPSPRRRVFAFVGGGAAALTVLAFAIVLMQGLPGRFSPDVIRLASYLEYGRNDAVGSACFIAASRANYADYDTDRCLRRSATQPNVLLIGDSHAAHLRAGLEATLGDVNLMQATASRCKPILRRRLRDAEGCFEMMRYVYRDYLPNNHVDLVIISARWFERDLPDVAETVRWLNQIGVETVLVGPVVQYNAAVPQLLALAEQHNDPRLPLREMRTQERRVDRAMQALAAREGVRYASPYQAMCPEGACMQVLEDGVPIQHDYGHLTREGSVFVVGRLRDEGAFTMARTNS